MIKIILPELGEGVSKATVACWHIKEGDFVAAGDEVCEVTTDKATFNVESTGSGRLKSITVNPGEDVSVGGVLGIIEQV